MMTDIVEARVLAGHRLYIRFEDGVSGEVDLRDLIVFKGVFESLRDPGEIAKVSVDPEIGTIYWPNGADLDPDVLYSRISGEPLESVQPDIRMSYFDPMLSVVGMLRTLLTEPALEPPDELRARKVEGWILGPPRAEKA